MCKASAKKSAEEKLRKPDDEDGFNGDVRGSSTAYIFEYVETMVLNDLVHQNTLEIRTAENLWREETYEDP